MNGTKTQDEYQQHLLKELQSSRDRTKAIATQAHKYYGREDIVLQEGGFFNPAPRPKGVRKMKDSNCYQNATLTALDNPELTYCEGYALSATVLMLIHHAWLVDKQGNVIDVTWKDTGLVYYGIPFNTSYLESVMDATKHYGVMGIFNEQHDPMFNGLPADAVKRI